MLFRADLRFRYSRLHSRRLLNCGACCSFTARQCRRELPRQAGPCDREGRRRSGDADENVSSGVGRISQPRGQAQHGLTWAVRRGEPQRQDLVSFAVQGQLHPAPIGVVYHAEYLYSPLTAPDAERTSIQSGKEPIGGHFSPRRLDQI